MARSELYAIRPTALGREQSAEGALHGEATYPAYRLDVMGHGHEKGVGPEHLHLLYRVRRTLVGTP